MSRDKPDITESQFYKIAGACDRVLRHPETGIEWMAIPWLHVLSQHPIHLAWYAGLFAEEQESEASWEGGFVRGQALATKMAKLGRSFVRAAAWRVKRAKGVNGTRVESLLTPPIAQPKGEAAPTTAISSEVIAGISVLAALREIRLRAPGSEPNITPPARNGCR